MSENDEEEFSFIVSDPGSDEDVNTVADLRRENRALRRSLRTKATENKDLKKTIGMLLGKI